MTQVIVTCRDNKTYVLPDTTAKEVSDALIGHDRVRWTRSTETSETFRPKTQCVILFRAHIIGIEEIEPSVRHLTMREREALSLPPENPAVVHACPPQGSSVSPCCGRIPFEMSRFDRITLDPDAVTCRGVGSADATAEPAATAAEGSTQ